MIKSFMLSHLAGGCASGAGGGACGAVNRSGLVPLGSLATDVSDRWSSFKMVSKRSRAV